MQKTLSMKQILHLITLLSLPLMGFAQKAMFQSDYIRTFEGSINGKLPVVFQLAKTWESLEGRYYYTGKPTKSFINLSGNVDSNGKFTIYEVFKGKTTGQFVGQIDANLNAKGTWSDSSGKKKYPFVWKAQKSLESKSVTTWEGTWYRNLLFNEGIMMIGNIQNNEFQFNISVSSGGNQGTISGFAKIDGQKATRIKSDYPDCNMIFTFKKDSVMIDATGAGFTCGLGNGVSLGGRYEKKYRKPEPSVRDFFKTAETHAAFKKMLGAKRYETFAGNFQYIDEIEIAAADKALISKGMNGWIRGLAGFNTSILCQDAKGHFWAAFVESDGKKESILYGTNSKPHLKKMPQTIANWCKNHVYEIKYLN
jgi:hypothetical protein